MLAAQALDQAVACGSVRVAQAGEPEIVSALAPLAESAGSQVARALLLDGRELIVRLFGPPRAFAADGSAIPLPPGMPGEVVRCWHCTSTDWRSTSCSRPSFQTPPRRQHGSDCDRCSRVCVRPPATWSCATVTSSGSCRPGSTHGSSWPPAIVFAGRAELVPCSSPMPRSHDTPARCCRPTRTPHGPKRRATRFATATSALLDLVAAYAAAHGSHKEALTALEAALAEDPEDEDRRAAVAEQLVMVGRRQTAA